MLRLSHLASGRQNFDLVSEDPVAASEDVQVPTGSQTTPNAAEKADGTTIDKQTNEAIKTANASPKKT